MTKIENFTKALIQKKTQKPQDSYILNFPNQKKKKKITNPRKEKSNQENKIKKTQKEKKKISKKKKRIV